MVKLIVISTAVILVFVNCLAQPAPCLDVVDGEYVNGQLFFDPVYGNGQSFGYYNRSVVDNDNQIQRISMDQPGFLWHWVSSYFTPYNRNSGSALLPVLKTEPDSPQTGAFDFFFAPSVNGEFFSNNYGKLTRTCGKDNMTLVDGPGPMIPQTKGNWILSNLVPYNLTFSQQLYVPSGSSSNWARLVHFIKAESDVEINYWSDSVWAVQLFVHSQSVAERYHLYTDLDQGAFLRMPTTINFMGENGRTMVTAANNADCSSTSTSAQTFKLKAGQTAAFAHFVSQNFDVNQAVSTAQWIDTQPTEAFAKLTDDELSQIMNWDACAAVLGPQVTVKVDQSDKCSKTPQFSISVTTSLSYTSTHRVIRTDGSVAQSVSDTSFTMSESGTFTLETWMNNCIVKRTPFDVVINDLAFSANTFSGSNKPFSFSFDSATKTVTATDTCGCKAEGVLSA